MFRTNFGPRQYDARRPQQQQNQQPPSPLLQLMQFAPLLLLLLFSYLSRPSTPVSRGFCSVSLFPCLPIQFLLCTLPSGSMLAHSPCV